MDTIIEKEILTNVRLSQTHKFILAKLVLPDTTPQMAYGFISTGRNIIANRDTLLKLNMLEIGDNTANITDSGKDAMREEGLLDDSGTLTQQGEEYAFAKDIDAVNKFVPNLQNNQPKVDPDSTAITEPNDGPAPKDISPTQDSVTPPMESWDMILDMEDTLSEQAFLAKFNKKL